MTRSWLLVVGLFLLALGRVTGKGLRDDPIVGDFVQYLDEYTWKASSAPRSVAATVPGDLITDLWRAGAVGDPMVEENWLVSGLWDKNDWNYTVTFPSDMPNGVTELVFDGVKMGAYVYLNDAFLGTINNQFLRYRFPITPILKSSNTLVVSFPAQSKGIDCEGRYMACTGGWDWAPYSNTVDQHNSPTMTKGIWKSVYTMSYSSVAISHIVPQIFYQGEYPTSILSDSSHDGFVVRVGVNLTAARNMDGLLLVSGDWGVAQTSLLKLNKGENFEVIELAAKGVKLWWPIGLGEQNLYNIKVSWEPKDATVVSTTRQIGFRVFTLVSANDTDPSTLKGKDGSSSFTLRFKVNGANVYSRGANVIPMEEFEGRANVNALRQLVQSAADAKMNTLRVWGGGIFMYDEFYDACDRLGILVYQDMMYAQIGHFPAATQSQLNELIHQVSRLSHHPSIVLWDGCNECDGAGLYSSFVMTTVAKVDQSRPIWPSCPAAGWVHGVDSLWGLPNGIPLVTSLGSHPHETHGPYQHGNGFKAVNDPDGKLILFDANVPPKVKKSDTGAEVSGVYASEFGCSVFSSFESMSPTLSQEHWSVHAPPMYQRNYPCDNIIIVYWGNQDFTQTGELPFKRQLYQCMLGQAIEMKSDIEVRRSTNEFGTVLWQLNEIWPTGGWGSLEYGSPYPGQVMGGRWKPLHYWLKDTLFTDVFASCDFNNDPVQCFIKNDGVESFSGQFTVTLLRFSDGAETIISSSPVKLAAGAGTTSWRCALSTPNGCETYANILKMGGCANTSSCIAILNLNNSTGELLQANEIALSVPKTWVLPSPNITLAVDEKGTISVQSDAVAAYFTLTTQAQGRFDLNCFFLRPGSTTISFIPFGPLDVPTLRKTLRFEHVQLYQ